MFNSRKKRKRRSPLEVAKDKSALLREQCAAIQLKGRKGQLERLYDAGAASNYHRKINTSRSADGVMDHARGTLRDQARHLDENHDVVIGILDSLVNNIIGTGIPVEPMVTNNAGKPIKKINDQLRKAWKQWTKRPEVTNELAFDEVQRQVCRSWLRDGEILIQKILGRQRPINYPTAVPFLLELIEADFLPWDLTDKKKGIIHGVQKNAWGQPVIYHLYKEHPGNTLMPFASISPDIKQVPARIMMHLKFCRRVGQTRGVTVLHGVLHRLDDMKDYEESERIAARVAAAFTGFIKKSGDYVEPDSDGARNMEMNPGMIFDDLLPGEEIGTIGSNRPNTNLDQFIGGQLRRVAAGVGGNASTISKNYTGNYSAQRQEMVESGPNYGRMRNYFISTFLQDVYETFVEATILSGQVVVPSSADLDTLTQAHYQPPAMPWIDPKKEIEADALAVEKGFKSRSQVIRERGGDPSVVDKEIQMEAEAAEKLKPKQPEVKPEPGAKGPAPGDEENDDDDEAAA